MADCTLCNAPIRWVWINGKKVALDQHEVGPGQERYTEVEGEWRPVKAQANVQAFAPHRSTCPYSR